MTTYLEKLNNMGACQPALDWCHEYNFKNLQQAWDKCERVDWLLWLLYKTGTSNQKLCLLACAFTRKVIKLTEEYNPTPNYKNVMDITERYAYGKATDEELVLAYKCDYHNVAYYAACSAARYAANKQYWCGSHNIDYNEISKQQCDIIRKMMKCPKLK